MVFVKVRETYDLQTITNKMSVIAIHTPRADIIKANYPGLLMQCKAYRPYSCDVKIACASVLPMDPLGVGTAEGDVAPEDLFNPILYKATSNVGMSQIEARITALAQESQNVGSTDVYGNSASVDVDSVTSSADEFSIYYGLLSNTHSWKHANPQQGLQMLGLKPLVYEMLYNVGDNENATQYAFPATDGSAATATAVAFRGNSKPMPMLNCTSYSSGSVASGFTLSNNSQVANHELTVPAPQVVCGIVIIPPSRLHQLFYRMVVEWTLEFSGIRPLSEIVGFSHLGVIGTTSHFQNYNYSTTKEALTGTADTVLESDVSLASSNVDIKKVM